MTGICISGSGELRSEEAILAKIEAIKLNFRELREIQAALSSENAADLYELLIQGNKNWFRDIEFEGKTVNEVVMGNPDEEVPENLKDGIIDNLYKVSATGFGTLHNILGIFLGETKEVPDQAEKGVPADYDLIIADYAKDMKARLGIAV